MENLYSKEQRLETALEKLKNLSNSFSNGDSDINSLSVEKNQLQSEKDQIERKYNQLLSEYDTLKKNLSKKFKEMRSLAIDYKGGKDKEILNLNSELDKFKKMVEESQGIYEKMLEKTTQSLEEIIKNSENSSKVQ